MIDANSKARLTSAIVEWLKAEAELEEEERREEGKEKYEFYRTFALLFEKGLGVVNVPTASYVGIHMGKDIMTAEQVALEATELAILAVENALEHASMSGNPYRSEEW